MPTPAERQALVFFAAVAALGVGVNAWRAVRGGEAVVTGSPSELAAQIARVDSAVASSPAREFRRASLRKRSDARPDARQSHAPPAPVPMRPSDFPVAPVYRPPSTVWPVDLDLAPVSAIESLPRIGPALAGRILANRDSFGAFGSLDGLQRVRGIGPALAKALRDRVSFSGVPRPGTPTGGDKKRPRRVAP